MQLTTISLVENKPFSIIVDNVNDKVIAPYILEHKIWEPSETDVVINLLTEGQNVIDVGANIGYYTILFSKIVGDKGKIYSFEPEPRNFSLLQANILINDLKNVVLENKALSDSNGRTSLYLSEHNKGDHRLAYTPNRESCLVDFQSLDNYLINCERKIHFIKSDTQGHELRVLNGMKNTIRKNIDHLCCLMEFSPGLLEATGKGGLDKFLGFLSLYPSEIYWIEEADRSSNLSKVNVNQLRHIAIDMLQDSRKDYSRDILIFFNSVARIKFFSKSVYVDKY